MEMLNKYLYILTLFSQIYNKKLSFKGELPERLNGTVLKTVEDASPP